MDLSTDYLGLHLKSPLMPGASPLVNNLDVVKRLEDAGAAAIVMHSLFQEQIPGEKLALIYRMELYADESAGASSYFPRPEEYVLGPVEYLDHLERIKRCVSVPVIGSLNGVTPGGWLNWARLIEQAGADALELNVYFVPTNPRENSTTIESRVVEIVRLAADQVSIPLAVKLAPFYTSLPSFAWELDQAGADGLVLFNRFAQPDIDIEALEARTALGLSDSSELLLRLRWLAILSSQVSASLAVSGGVHTHTDALKAILAGAEAVQIVSELLEHGPERLGAIELGMKRWMERNGYTSVRQMRGSMTAANYADAQSFERANYLRALQGFSPRLRHQ
jgi:dihydroorotate dehydrogenase (fumarate)